MVHKKNQIFTYFLKYIKIKSEKFHKWYHANSTSLLTIERKCPQTFLTTLVQQDYQNTFVCAAPRLVQLFTRFQILCFHPHSLNTNLCGFHVDLSHEMKCSWIEVQFLITYWIHGTINWPRLDQSLKLWFFTKLMPSMPKQLKFIPDQIISIKWSF